MLGPTACRVAARNSFGHPGLLQLNRADQFLQALTLSVEHAPAQLRQPVITATRIIQFWRRPFVRFVYQIGLDEPLDRSIERRRPQPHLSGGAVQDFLHDSVAVLFATRKREHDVEPLSLEWKKPLNIDIGHIQYIY